jgi:hypothetical protein
MMNGFTVSMGKKDEAVNDKKASLSHSDFARLSAFRVIPAAARMGPAGMVRGQFLKPLLFNQRKVFFNSLRPRAVHLDPQGIQFRQGSAADSPDYQEVDPTAVQGSDWVAGPMDMMEVLVLDIQSLVLLRIHDHKGRCGAEMPAHLAFHPSGAFYRKTDFHVSFSLLFLMIFPIWLHSRPSSFPIFIGMAGNAENGDPSFWIGPLDGYFFFVLTTQGWLFLEPWHFLICLGEQSAGLPRISSGRRHPFLFSEQHMLISLLSWQSLAGKRQGIFPGSSGFSP